FRAYFFRAHAELQQGDLVAAKQDYQNALDLKPDDATILFHLGTVHRLTADGQAAEACLSRVLEIDPDHIAAHVQLGCILESNGNLDEAADHYENAILADTRCAEGYRRIGVLRCRQGSYDKAFDGLTRATELGDDSDELLYHQGLVLANMDD